MKNFNLQNIIKFYRDCYQREYSTEKVLNFYSSSVSDLYYPDTFKILSKNEYALPVDTEWGKKILLSLELNSSEKKLICGSFFLKGKIELLGKSHQIFTPLFLNEILLKYSNEVYFLEVDHHSMSLNPVAINYLNSFSEDFTLSNDGLYSDIFKIKDVFTFGGLVKLQELLKERFPTLNLDLIEDRIKSDDRISNLTNIYRSKKSEYRNTLFPDILVGMIEKPKKSKDVINELAELSERRHSKLSILAQIFNINDSLFRKKNKATYSREIVVPVSLSQNQEKILSSSNKSNVSLVVGPPGTGKSFSIAALAIQAFYEGKKVLIASKNQQACQVIFNKIENDIGIKGISINASKARYKISVSSKLKNIANGIGVKPVNIDNLKKIGNEVIILKNTINRIIKEITLREGEEIKWGKKLASSKEGIFHAIQKKWIEYRHSYNEPIWELKYSLHTLDKKLKKKERQLLKLSYQNNLNKLLEFSRSELLQYEKAFKESRGNLIKEIFSSVDFNVVLRVLPIWICKSVDIANIAPLKEELFDLLIIDEASQCDISSSIPIIYRSKSITVVGDPNQLRHISFISNRTEELIKKRHNVNSINLAYRKRSILDHINESIGTQDNVIFLDEHFRSMPDIINFSNNQFYSGQLKIMTDQWRENDFKNLKLKYIEDGIRNQKGENYKEAEFICNSIVKIIDSEKENIKSNCTTIGVISPFRHQVQLIKKTIREQIEPSSITKHKILVGTPFHFQGEERDIVFLSFTIDKNTHHGVVRYLERPDVFNVSITRAKNRKVVCISVDPNELNRETLLSKYLSYRPEKRNIETDKTSYDNFLNEVKQAIIGLNKGKILVNKNICGVNIDIAIIQENRTLGIDLIGFPGEFIDQISMAEVMSLERANIDIFMLPYSTWYFNNDLCMKSLLKFIEN